MTAVSGVRIRPAALADVPQIATFIRDLARYEKLEHQVDLDEGRLREHLFGPVPACGALLADCDGVPAGFALHFATYSTFRGRGIGLALLRAVAAVAIARGCPRLDWQVLDWNVDAIGFYEKQGARLLHDWRVCRLEGDELTRCAALAGS